MEGQPLLVERPPALRALSMPLLRTLARLAEQPGTEISASLGAKAKKLVGEEPESVSVQ